jgi:hypothetical protein
VPRIATANSLGRWQQFSSNIRVMQQFRTHFVQLTILLSFSLGSQCQTTKDAKDSILKNINIWNNSFNSRDTTNYFKLIDKDIAITAGGGTVVGISVIKDITLGLFKDRPDIKMYLKSSSIEVNKQWWVAYDSGEWNEVWTENNAAAKSEIRGKYWRMWKRHENNWIIMSIILTPLSCKGSYCR